MSSETKTQVTFKRIAERNSGASYYPYLNGLPVNGVSISKDLDATCVNRHTPNPMTSGYTVHFETVSKTFSVADYSSARSALAAAKRYAKETLSAPAPAPAPAPAAEETLQDKVNALPLKSFKVLAAVIPAMFDDESSCYLEDVTVEGMSVHAVTGTLPRLIDFVSSEDLAASGSGKGYLINLNPNYDVYSLYAAIKTRAEAPAAPAAAEEEASSPVEEESVPAPPAEAPRYTEEEQQLTFNLFKHDTRDLRVLRVICSSCESGADKLELIRALKEYLGGGEQSAATWLGYFTNVCPHIAESGAGYTVNVTAAQVTLELVNRGAETPVLDETLETRNPFYHLYTKRGESWEYNSSWYDLHNRDAQRAALEARGLEVKEDFQACKDGVLEGKHNGAYVYDIPCSCPKCTSSPAPAAEEALEPLVKGLPEAPAAEEEEPSSPVEEEARVIRVTPPQVDALRALGYEVKSCKLRYYPSQVEELLERLYAERETRTRGARRVYTSLIERVSAPTSKIKRAKGAPRAFFNSGDLRIEYTSDSAHRQLMQLVDAAESTGLISAASARALRASTATPRALPEATEEEYTGSSALARFMGR